MNGCEARSKLNNSLRNKNAIENFSCLTRFHVIPVPFEISNKKQPTSRS